MKFTLAPLVSLLFGASYLVASAAAYSYLNVRLARYQIDDVLSERGFGLEARETVDVPFQPSLRAFLEEAVTAHRRSMSEDEEDLEARALVDVTAHIFEGPPGPTPQTSVTMQVNRHAVTVSFFKQAIERRHGIKLASYTASVPTRGYKICYGEQMLDECLGGRGGGVVVFSPIPFQRATPPPTNARTSPLHTFFAPYAPTLRLRALPPASAKYERLAAFEKWAPKNKAYRAAKRRLTGWQALCEVIRLKRVPETVGGARKVLALPVLSLVSEDWGWTGVVSSGLFADWMVYGQLVRRTHVTNLVDLCGVVSILMV
ncbi:hypothetical protein DFP72DRAFT_1128220 [Ephemerocybe angulata]|uniref:Uncharacterized protein n=1 Tax=Ephemerocybe angulata TaxID=980116 RepID=A0A8H6M734_9AGAR|nr:hypothetical protein DFP72DRAFT_1128220 [Tulosesus angulatus]